MVNDLREFIEELDKRGQLRKIEGADWDLEIGTITELVAERGEPALLFDKIKGYPSGFRVFSNGNTEIGQRITFGIDEKLPNIEVIKQWKDKWAKYKPIPPVEVKSGPVMENILTGGDINMFQFPTPKWHEQDGGRYIGTGVTTITKDPEEGWLNCGTYRVMVHDKKTVSFYVSPGKHAAIMREKYWAKGESCPVVMCFGPEPLLLGMSTMALPWGISEFDMAGYIKGKPIEVIKGRFTGLPIPATGEIAIEGFSPLPSIDSRPEGPFGEWTGYYASGTRTEPVVQVKAVYYRNNPVIYGQPPLKGVSVWYPIPLHVAAPLWNQLETVGITGIKGVYVHGVGGRVIGVISIEQSYLGHAKQVANLAASLLQGGACTGRYIIVVDEDIDPSNWEEVIWAICTRCDPESSIDIVRGFLTSPLDPALSPQKRAMKDFTTSKVIINACKPYHWIKEFPPVNKSSDGLRKKVIEKWSYLLSL